MLFIIQRHPLMNQPWRYILRGENVIYGILEISGKPPRRNGLLSSFFCQLYVYREGCCKVTCHITKIAGPGGGVVQKYFLDVRGSEGVIVWFRSGKAPRDYTIPHLQCHIVPSVSSAPPGQLDAQFNELRVARIIEMPLFPFDKLFKDRMHHRRYLEGRTVRGHCLFYRCW